MTKVTRALAPFALAVLLVACAQKPPCVRGL